MSKKRISVQIPTSKAGKELNLKKKQKISKNEIESKSESESEDDTGLDVGSDASIEMEDDDELDLHEVSSDDGEDSDEDSDEGSDADENLPKLKKRKKNADDGSESFASAVNAILGSKLKAYDRKDPILARSKQTVKKFESEKLEAKARRALLAEKKKVYDKDRVKDLLPKENENARAILEHERQLKKIAQRGVVKLFNVLMATQNKTSNEVSKTKVLGEEQKQKLITEVSKEKFFDMVKAAGQK